MSHTFQRFLLCLEGDDTASVHMNGVESLRTVHTNGICMLAGGCWEGRLQNSLLRELAGSH